MKEPYVTKSGKTLIIPKEYLIHIFTQIEKKPNKALGICGNLLNICESYADISSYQIACHLRKYIQNTLQKWPHYSGDIRFPIPSGNKQLTPERYFYQCDTLWKGKQLKYRKSLLQYLRETAKTIRVKL
jgi:hypothetical protein